MKRALLASILGIATVVSSYGQGFVYFDNYANFGGAGAQITMPGGAGIPVNFTVNLNYALGTVVDPLLVSSLAATTSALNQGPGYFSNGGVTIPNYVSGAITFQLNVTGTSGGLDYVGHSSLLTLSSIATGLSLPTYLDIPSFSVVPVPEPSTFALLGLGAAAMRPATW